MISDQVNTVTYLRLLMPLLLPEDVGRVIYLDADMLVRHDLAQLWDEPQGEEAALAVQDIAAPWIDAEQMLPNIDRCRQYLAAIKPVVNFRALSLPADGKYLNGGMLVANIATWRREQFPERMLAMLRDHREHILWWDQYALNIVLAGRWRAVDHRWNQGAHLFVYPDWRHSPLDRQAFRQLRRDPWIVHFCSPSKPWQYFCHHPYSREFFYYLDRTNWQGWRPERPEGFLKKWWEFHYRPLRSEINWTIRAAQLAVRRKRAA
jgi:lipopolysaccharide biosynthesis glycosyltransferase